MNSFSVTYDAADELILIVLIGPVDMPLIESLRLQVMQLVAEHACPYMLVDARDAQSAMSVAEIFQQPQRTADDLAEIGLEKTRFCRAYVVGPDRDDLQFYEMVAANRGHCVKVFSNIADAKAWLAEFKTTE